MNHRINDCNASFLRVLNVKVHPVCVKPRRPAGETTMSTPAPMAFEVDSRDRESSAATTSLGVALASFPRSSSSSNSSSNSSRRRENRRCPFCDKLFCCVDCRRCHEIEKHPDRQLDCPLCRAEKLEPGQIPSDELLTHVVIGHLPLRCLLCGDEFKLYKDLQSPGPCKWWSTRHRRTAPQVRQGSVVRGARNTFTPPCDELATRRRSAHATTELSMEVSGNGNYGNFTSPPVLFRNTSTPMHVGLTAEQQRSFEYKTPKILSTTDSQVEESKGSAPPFSRGSRETDRSETRFVTCSSSSSLKSSANTTPLRSESGAGGSCSCDFPVRTDSGRWLSRELEEAENIADLTRGRGADVLSHESRRVNADPAKRVRFSDQFQVVSEIADAGRSLDATEELYHEARESVSEMPIREGRLSTGSDAAYESCDVLESALETPTRAKGDEQSASTITDSTSGAASARPERSPNRSQILACRENERNEEKEYLVDAEQGNGAVTDDAASGQRTVRASRVLMMVVVERNLPGSGSDDALAPLIASSLRELEKHVSADNHGSSIPSPLAGVSDGDSSSRNARKIVAVTTVDSYSSISSVEYLATDSGDVPACPAASSKPLDRFSATDENKENSGGIFSAVAQAMKSAFGKLSGTNVSKDATKEPSSEERSDRASPSSVASTSSPAGLSTLASSLLQRPGKRSRDVIEGSLAAGPSGIAGSRTEARSPAAKRPRGWQGRIRAREPLARMRSGRSAVASTRGISSETQHFQRGSLSVGDTVLPIPSRAHRSTQTD